MKNQQISKTVACKLITGCNAGKYKERLVNLSGIFLQVLTSTFDWFEHLIVCIIKALNTLLRNKIKYWYIL